MQNTTNYEIQASLVTFPIGKLGSSITQAFASQRSTKNAKHHLTMRSRLLLWHPHWQAWKLHYKGVCIPKAKNAKHHLTMRSRLLLWHPHWQAWKLQYKEICIPKATTKNAKPPPNYEIQASLVTSPLASLEAPLQGDLHPKGYHQGCKMRSRLLLWHSQLASLEAPLQGRLHPKGSHQECKTPSNYEIQASLVTSPLASLEAPLQGDLHPKGYHQEC